MKRSTDRGHRESARAETLEPRSYDPGLSLEADRAVGPSVAAHIAILEADQALALRLALHGYQGHERNKFATALAEYGLQIIAAWVRKGIIFAKCREKGMGVAPVPWLREGVDDLARETVAYAIHSFRQNVLIPGVWNAAGGASLKTFFVGQCLFQFPNVYRRWKRDTAPEPIEPLLEAIAPSLQPLQPVLLQLERSIRSMAVGSAEWIAASMAMGESQKRVAAAAGITEGALELRLFRLRRKAVL